MKNIRLLFKVKKVLLKKGISLFVAFAFVISLFSLYRFENKVKAIAPEQASYQTGTVGTYYTICEGQITPATNPATNAQIRVRSTDSNSIIEAWSLDTAHIGLSGTPNGNTIHDAAVSAKAYLDLKPAGKRVIGYSQNIFKWLTASQNYMWANDILVKQMKDGIDEFFRQFSLIGGQVDYINMDWEWFGPGVQWLNNYPTNKAMWLDIENDPRFSTDIKPRLEYYGWRTKSSEPYMYYMYQNSSTALESDGESINTKRGTNQYIWEQVNQEIQANILNKTYYNPAKKYYPDVYFANYDFSKMNSDYRVPDLSGCPVYNIGQGNVVGTSSAPVLYGWLWNISVTTPPGTSAGQFEKTPFHGLVHGVNLMRQTTLSDPSTPVQPYVAWSGFDKYVKEGGTFAAIKYGQQKYYFENLLHIGLCNPKNFIGWLPPQDYWNNWSSDWMSQSELNEIGDTMKELDEIVGFNDRVSLMTDIVSFSTDYMLTGMKANGNNIWRITPDVMVNGMSEDDYKVQQGANYTAAGYDAYIQAKIDAFKTSSGTSNPTFQISGKTIQFPNGSYIYTSQNAANSSYGYWVVSPAGTVPTENGVSLKVNTDAYSTIPASATEKKRAVGADKTHYIVSDVITSNDLNIVDGKIENINNYNYVEFKNVDMGTGVSSIDIKYAAQTGGGTIEVWLDSIKETYDGKPYGKKLGEVTVTSTGGSSTYTTINTSLANVAKGKHHIYLLYKDTNSNPINLESIKFNQGTYTEPSRFYGDYAVPTWSSGSVTAESITNTTATLNWTTASDNDSVTGYNVYKVIGASKTFVATTSANSYALTSLQAGKQYTYKVEAVDRGGKESTTGPSVTFTTTGTLDTVKPTWQTGSLTATNIKPTTLTLNWPVATDNVGIEKYNIYKGGVLLSTVAASENSYLAYGLEPNTSYSFSVEAVDVNGNATLTTLQASVATIAGSKVGYWRLKNSNGTSVVDALGNGNNATYVNGLTINEEGAEFNGASSVVKFGDIFNPQMDSYTASVWFKIPEDFVATGSHYIASKGNVRYANGWRIELTIGNVIKVRANAGQGDYQLTSNAGITDTDWHNVIMVIDRKTNVVRSYLDGQNSTFSETIPATSPIESFDKWYPIKTASDLTLGAGSSAADSVTTTQNYFTGTIGDLSIYNYAVQSTSVGGMYTAEHPYNNLTVATSGISLDKTRLTLTQGQVDYLAAAVQPLNADIKSVVYSSSDKTVAVVVSKTGKITAMKAGTATITVKTVQGDFSKTCTVEIKDKATQLPLDTLSGDVTKTYQYGVSSYTKAQDTMIIETDAHKNNNFGARTAADFGRAVGNTASDDRNALVKFDITDIPSNATIIDATLETTVFLASANTFTKKFGIFQMVESWNEGTKSTSAATAGEASWISSTFPNKWATAGGDYLASPMEVKTFVAVPADVNVRKKVVWNIKSAVKDWVKNSSINNGVLLTETEAVGSSSMYRLVTKEDSTVADRPKLTIKYRIAPLEVKLSQNEIVLNAGNTKAISAEVLPSTAVDKTLSWVSSNTAVATVNTSGEVTAVANGNAVITAYTNDNYATSVCNVTVTSDALSTSVNLNKASAEIIKGGALQLVATSKDKPTWTTSNSAVATVDSYGNVTAVGAGTATIAATANGNSASCIVTVKTISDITATNITTNAMDIFWQLPLGDTAVAGYNIYLNGTLYKNVPKTSNYYALTGLTNGAQYTIKLESVNASAQVISSTTKVVTLTKPGNYVDVTSVSLSSGTLAIVKGQSKQLTETISPSNATDKLVLWSSDNEMVAKVNNGVVTAVGGGTTTVRATTANGTKLATCTVTVNSPVVKIIMVDVTATVFKNSTLALTAYVAPNDATTQQLTYSSSNTGVATVNTSGVVSGVTPGTAVITATSADGLRQDTISITVLPIIKAKILTDKDTYYQGDTVNVSVVLENVNNVSSGGIKIVELFPQLAKAAFNVTDMSNASNYTINDNFKYGTALGLSTSETTSNWGVSISDSDKSTIDGYNAFSSVVITFAAVLKAGSTLGTQTINFDQSVTSVLSNTGAVLGLEYENKSITVQSVSGMTSYWKFDEACGTTYLKDEVIDYGLTGTTSTRCYDGVGGSTFTAPTLVAGKFGNAMQFTRSASPTNGTTGTFATVLTNKTTQEPGADSFSVSVWFKRNSGGTGVDNQIQVIANKGSENRNSAGWTIQLSATGYLYVRATTLTANNTLANNGTTETCAGQTFATNAIDYTNWHNVIMVIEKDAITGNRTIKGYLDGSNTGWVNQLATNGDGNFNVISGADNVITDTNPITSTILLGIGASGSSSKGNRYNGLLDDMRIYGGALTQTQIDEIINPSSELQGDVDNNFVVNSADAMLVLKHEAGIQSIPDARIKYADMNLDGKIDGIDALIILENI